MCMNILSVCLYVCMYISVFVHMSMSEVRDSYEPPCVY